MSDALLLGAGASWAAYQVGAIEQLVGERRMEFDAYVGCGVGAMHAALLACGQYEAIGPFWDSINSWKLVRPSLTPWRAPARNTPQRRFVAGHVSERALRDRGTTLAITTLDLVSGSETVHRYPGDDVPLVDAVMAAVATPGMLIPLASGDRLLAEATFVDSVPSAAVPTDPPPDRVIGVLPAMPVDSGAARRYGTWPAVAMRTIEVNLNQDRRRAVALADETRGWHADAESVIAEVTGLAGDDTDLAARLRSALAPLESPAPTHYVWISPSQRLDYPMFRFPSAAMSAARRLGRADAALVTL
jgi:predicted acylesterase/phospholipase RssA